MKRILLVLTIAFLSISCSNKKDEPIPEVLQMQTLAIGGSSLLSQNAVEDAALSDSLVATFSDPIEHSSLKEQTTIKDNGGNQLALRFHFKDGDRTVFIGFADSLHYNTTYNISFGTFSSQNNKEFPGGDFSFKTQPGKYKLLSLKADTQDLMTYKRVQNVSANFTIEASFSEALASGTNWADYVKVISNGNALPLKFSLSTDGTTLQISPQNTAAYLTKYSLLISDGMPSAKDYVFSGYTKDFYTQLDSTYKFAQISDSALLTKVEAQTFKYFWDLADPTSGLAKERNTSGETVTIGGSGFGLMAILVGVERGFITRQQGVDRIQKIVNFLKNADRFHGAWPHWMNGSTGKVIPFSTYDDGGDLVETAFMMQGLLTVREYLNGANTQEAAIKNTITTLWEGVEWDWYTQGGQNVLYWHWSPNYGWQMNMPIHGWDEALIVYVLAAASPTHSIDPAVYHQGWARNGDMVNGNSYYNITLPLGGDKGGPLFFAHYSFLGLDPRNLQDQYANYWTQNVHHSQINQAYCIENHAQYIGYSASCWGLTASDDPNGYAAHSPTNDTGTITPTAALSSLPYTPQASMKALHTFYYLLGDKLWGDYGFYDAFDLTKGWTASSYLAIDQGPIIVMTENYRTGLLWNLFMQNPEIGQGLEKLGFTSY